MGGVDTIPFDRSGVNHRDLRGKPNLRDPQQLGNNPLQVLPVDEMLIPWKRLSPALHKDLLRAIDANFIDQRVFHRLRNRPVVRNLIDQRLLQLNKLQISLNDRLLRIYEFVNIGFGHFAFAGRIILAPEGMGSHLGYVFLTQLQRFLELNGRIFILQFLHVFCFVDLMRHFLLHVADFCTGEHFFQSLPY
ncbi:hypothetical protein D3C77_429340 [compost metagenome]